MTVREKGVESAACPTCGNELAVSDQPDGSVAAETCTACYPQEAPKAEKASAPQAVATPRETGTNVKEQ
jgi:hypothetical protein